MPNPNINMGIEYWCSMHCCDTEPTNDACDQMIDKIKTCNQCGQLCRQYYTIKQE